MVLADMTRPARNARRDQRANRGRAGGCPPLFDPVIYKRRNIVERCFNRLQQFRAIATRCDKIALSCQVIVDLATPALGL
ncbi:hypothetical protein ORI60_40855 [Lentzea sp. NEAU-D7]|nr:hypothetical protein [Lentzea sp. NEAU-D7]MCX2954706.1 hypothetical protein [Lentzea sp. NEAU-D7]